MKIIILVVIEGTLATATNRVVGVELQGVRLDVDGREQPVQGFVGIKGKVLRLLCGLKYLSCFGIEKQSTLFQLSFCDIVKPSFDMMPCKNNRKPNTTKILQIESILVTLLHTIREPNGKYTYNMHHHVSAQISPHSMFRTCL